jgi:ABC-type protease/lipase transport system fused ATPase/permease subunit
MSKGEASMSETNALPSTSRFGVISVILMVIPILSLVVITFVLEPMINSLPSSTQRTIMVLTLLLPALLGFVIAIAGLVKKERRKWLHVIRLIANLLESLYFGLLVLIAG